VLQEVVPVATALFHLQERRRLHVLVLSVIFRREVLIFSFCYGNIVKYKIKDKFSAWQLHKVGYVIPAFAVLTLCACFSFLPF
jgi:hypothetical protein